MKYIKERKIISYMIKQDYVNRQVMQCNLLALDKSKAGHNLADTDSPTPHHHAIHKFSEKIQHHIKRYIALVLQICCD
jgi:hypothetical protein